MLTQWHSVYLTTTTKQFYYIIGGSSIRLISTSVDNTINNLKCTPMLNATWLIILNLNFRSACSKKYMYIQVSTKCYWSMVSCMPKTG